MTAELSGALAAAFRMAASNDDVELVIAEFTRPEVRRDLEFWNDRLLRNSPIVESTHSSEQRFGDNCLVEAFRWLCAREQLGHFRVTVCDIGFRAVYNCIDENRVHVGEIIEVFVESAVFRHILGDSTHFLLHQLLHKAASQGQDRLVDMLVAYGALPTHEMGPITSRVAPTLCENAATGDVLGAHGMWLIGDKVITPNAFPRRLDGDALRYGADANATVEPFGTALHFAAQYGRLEAVRSLIHEGFEDVDARNASGDTPLLVASQASGMTAKKIVDLLLESRADVHAVNDQQQGVLHRAERVKCIQVFLERGADPNAQDHTGQTPLVVTLLRAVHWEAKLDVLLHAGADPFIEDYEGIDVVQLLEHTERGHAYLQKKHPFFCRSQ